LPTVSLYNDFLSIKYDEVVKSRKSDGTVKSCRYRARKSDGMRRTYLYAAMTPRGGAQRRQMARFSSLSPAVRDCVVMRKNVIPNACDES
jgi:hypothetical protein